jgi:hypothetical protein
MNLPMHPINSFTRCIKIQYWRFPPIVIWYSVVLTNLKLRLPMTINWFSYNPQTPPKISLKFSVRNFRSKLWGTPLVILCSTLLRIVSRVLVTETGFGLVIGFINHLQVVITITLTLFLIYTLTITPLQSSQSISTCLYYPFPGNGSQHTNYHTLNLQMLHINQAF